MKYVVYRLKKFDGVCFFSLDTIFDNETIAIGYCKQKNELCPVREEYFVQELSLCAGIVQHDLILRCKNIARCLYIADICMMKNGYKSLEKASYWLNLAKERSKIAADLLGILDEV